MSDSPKPRLVPFVPKEPPIFTDAADAVRKFLTEIESGEAKPTCMGIFYLEAQPNGNFAPRYWYQNMSVPERIAYGELIKADAIADWKHDQ